MKSSYEIKINKEIRDYTEAIAFGLSLRQTVFSILACVFACIIYFLFADHIGIEATSWLCILGVIPFACFGFIRYQGMYMEDIIITALCSLLLSTHNLINKPYNLYFEIYKPLIERSRKESLNYDKKLRTNKKIEFRKNKSS